MSSNTSDNTSSCNICILDCPGKIYLPALRMHYIITDNGVAKISQASGDIIFSDLN